MRLRLLWLLLLLLLWLLLLLLLRLQELRLCGWPSRHHRRRRLLLLGLCQCLHHHLVVLVVIAEERGELRTWGSRRWRRGRDLRNRSEGSSRRIEVRPR